MGGFVPDYVPCAKGAICYSLDQVSKNPGARARLRRLHQEISTHAPHDEGLADIFDHHLLSYAISDPDQRRRAVNHLKRHWFDANSNALFFPGKPVASLLAEGVLKALDLSLKGKRVVPINAWWILDFPEFRVLTLADVKDGVTAGGRVTLLIMTPRPQVPGRAGTAILGEEAEAHVTEHSGGETSTRPVRGMA